jgi:hypothetical protein
MIATYSSTFTDAVVIDASLMRKIAGLGAYVLEKNDASIRADKAHTDLAADLAARGMDKEYIEGAIKRRIEERLELYRKISFSVKYVDGSTLEVGSFDLLMEVIEAGSGSINSLSANFGVSPYTYFSLDIEDRAFWSANVLIKGSKETVSYLSSETIKILRDAKSDYPLLHSGWVNVLVRTGAAISGLFIAAQSLSWLRPMIQPAWFDPLAGFLLALVPFSFATLVAEPLVKQVKSAYPKCDFAFGNQGRRTGAKRRALATLAAAFVIPIFLAAVGLT